MDNADERISHLREQWEAHRTVCKLIAEEERNVNLLLDRIEIERGVLRLHRARREETKSDAALYEAWLEIARTRCDAVAPEDACPHCHESSVNRLVWADDGDPHPDTVRCSTCGTVYTPPNEGR